MATNYLALRSSALPVLNAVALNYSTLTGSTITTSTMAMNSTLIAFGQSTNQSVNNFSAGSYATGWVSTLTGLTAVSKVTMSYSGQSQYAVQNGNSTIQTTVNSGVNWTTLTGSAGLPTGSLAYQASASGTPAYTSISESATGQYVLAAVNGSLLYLSNNSGSSFSALGMGTPLIYLPMENNTTDSMAYSNGTVTGSVTYVTGIVGTKAVNLANSAGNNASAYIRGTVPASTAFSVSGWFNPQSTPASNGISVITSIGASNGNCAIVAYTNAADLGLGPTYTGITFYFYNASAAIVLVGNYPTVSLNTWYSFTYLISTTGTCYAYINNTLVGSVAGQSLYRTTGIYSIGCGTGNTAQSFNGYIDDYRFYNSVVTVSSIVPMNWLQTAVSGTGQYMLATSSAGLFLSSNYGVTWSLVIAIGSWTGLGVSASGQYMVALSQVAGYAPYYSTNYGVTWSTATFDGAAGSFIAISGNGQYSLTGYASTALLISNYLAGYGTTTYSTPTFSPSNSATINCASMSATGQYMVVLTQGSSNNVYYSTNYGSSFTALTVGSAAMTSCAMSADGSYLTVSNATTVYTLNLNTKGYSVSIGNATGVINQGQNAIAIGNQAGVTNQSANSMVLNGSGSALNAYAPGLFVSPIASYGSSYSSSFSLLGYGSDSQVVQSSSLFLGANGNMGIGTNASNTYLCVGPNGGVNQTTNIPGISMTSVSGSNMHYSVGQDSTHNAFFRWVYNATATSGYGSLQTYSGSNPLCLQDQGGYVGIGTNAPAYLLTVFSNILLPTVTVSAIWPCQLSVVGSPSAGLHLKMGAYYTGGVAEYCAIQSTEPYSGAEHPQPLSLQPLGGNVGIGTTNPNALLAINAGATNNMALTVNSSGTGWGSGIQFVNTTASTGRTYGIYTGSEGNFHIADATASSDRMVINSSGNVGIGTGAPRRIVDIVGAPSYPLLYAPTQLSLSDTVNSSYMNMLLGVNGTANYAAVQSSLSGTGAMPLLLNPAGGNVGIGTTNPAALLHVYGPSYTSTTVDNIMFNVTAADSINGNGGTTVYSQSINLHSGDLTWVGNRTYGAQIYIGGGYSVNAAVNHGPIVMYTSNAERMRVAGNGNVGIGTASPGYSLHVIGAIYASGDITAFSDQRYKQNIIRLDHSLDVIRSLSGYSYTREDYRPGERQIGLLAQEVKAVLPEAVSYDSTNDKYSVNYNCLMAPVVEAIKELYDRSESQAKIIRDQQSMIQEQHSVIQLLLDRLGPQ